MSNAPEHSGVAPSDGWFGQGMGGAKTAISYAAAQAPGDEVASGYRQADEADIYNYGPPDEPGTSRNLSSLHHIFF